MSETLQDSLYRELAGVAPYNWQHEAFQRFVAGDIPDRIKAPTAAGKSMILASFVAALATQASSGNATLPRRLVFVVNRRVLVDDATRLCESIRQIVLGNAIPELTSALTGMSAFHNPLAISTLRGQFADNGEWAADPSAPALILATPDMLGSRLLFRGYGGLGRNRSPMHAGLLGIDTLIVHDEAHLAPAFTTLLRDIEHRAASEARLLERPPLRVIEMTATLPPGGLPDRQPLECKPHADDRLAQRMGARKIAHIRQMDSASARQACIVDYVRNRALRQQAIAIFVASPSAASKLESALCAGKKPILDASRVVVLTGTMRGAEREALLQQPAWKRLAANRDGTDTETAVLIATGAGEIGIDLDADLLLCDDTTLDRQIQRFGRCNRRGLTTGEIVIFAEASTDDANPAAQRRARATALLRQLPKSGDEGFDASPLAISQLVDHPDYTGAIDPPPVTRDLEDAILDLYACTSCHANELNYPDPAIWIHGLEKEDRDVHLVWRHLPRDPQSHETWLAQWPIHRAEQVTLPFGKETSKLIAALSGRSQCPSIRLDASGAPLPPHWREVPSGGLIIFDCSAGGLTPKGLPNDTILQPASDVSAQQFGPEAAIATHRPAFDESEGIWNCEGCEATTVAELAALLHPQSQCAWMELIDGTLTLWLRPIDQMADDGDELLTTQERLLEEHLALAAKAAQRIATSLNLPEAVKAAFVRAADQHDRGKDRIWWQHAIGNFNTARPLGKSGKAFFNHSTNQGYRHELGSLADITDSSPLVRGLIAAHHGYNRPTVRPSALVHADCAEAANDAARNFANLTQEYGHWGLAYLEALLKCADVQAEIQAQTLTSDAQPETAPLDGAAASPGSASTSIPFDAANPGEYLAALGLLWLLSRKTPGVCLGWAENACTYHGVGDNEVIGALRELADGKARIDEDRAAGMAKKKNDKNSDANKFPPLILHIEEQDYPLNAWCNETFSDGSSWKYPVGRSDAFNILSTLLTQCKRSLSQPVHTANLIFTVSVKKKGRHNAEAKRFRYDAATSWTALDVGWSPNDENMSFSRPWIELLATIGIQAAFPPPAPNNATYFTWHKPLPLLIARIAARGLLSDRLEGYTPQIKSAGKNTDAYTSYITENPGALPCPHLLIV